MENQENITTEKTPDQTSKTSNQQRSTNAEQSNTDSTAQPQSYYNSESSLKNRINELTNIAEHGDQDAVSKAMEELSEIEQTLENAKKHPKKNEQVIPQSIPSSTQPPESGASQSQAQENAAPKKFSVHWQGEKVERDDNNNLLGFRTTGDLKAALIKSQLQLEEYESRTSSLTKLLRAAEEKLQTNTNAPVATPQSPLTIRPSGRTIVQRPVAPTLPVLSTKDPSLYSESDIAAIDTYQKASIDFNQKLIEYVATLENRSTPDTENMKSRLADIDKQLKQYTEHIEAEKKKIEEEKLDNEHWQRFAEFQNNHESFKTPLPLKKMNDVMNKWMDSIASANNVTLSSDGKNYHEYMGKRAQVVKKYLENDSVVTQNAQGLPPPEGHEAFFKLAELFQAWNKYTNNGANKDLLTLDQIYLLLKGDSGEMQDNIETIRTNERVKATQQFASGVQQLQQSAINIDPSKTSGGPDLNELGISNEDMNWFKSITPFRLTEMQKREPENFKKWYAMADRIEQKLTKLT